MKLEFSKEDMLLKVYPDITGCFEQGWLLMKKHFWLFVLSVVIVSLIDSPFWIFQIDEEQIGAWVIVIEVAKLFGFIYWVVVVGPFDYALDWMFVNASRNKTPKLKDIVLGFYNFVNVILARLLCVIIVALGFVFLIIPGIFLLCKLVFVPYLIMDKKVDPISAIKLSWYMSKGYFWTILGMSLVSFLLLIVGIVVLVVGVFVSITWIRASFALLYKAVEELHYKDACTLAGIPIIPDDRA